MLYLPLEHRRGHSLSNLSMAATLPAPTSGHQSHELHFLSSLKIINIISAVHNTKSPSTSTTFGWRTYGLLLIARSTTQISICGLYSYLYSPAHDFVCLLQTHEHTE